MWIENLAKKKLKVYTDTLEKNVFRIHTECQINDKQPVFATFSYLSALSQSNTIFCTSKECVEDYA